MVAGDFDEFPAPEQLVGREGEGGREKGETAAGPLRALGNGVLTMRQTRRVA